MGTGGLAQENSEHDQDWIFDVNLHGVIYGVRVFTPLILGAAKKDPLYEGHIVNTAPTAGLLSAPAMGICNASKYVVIALSELLYQDSSLTTKQTHHSVLCPYFMPIGITQSDRNRPQGLVSTTPSAKSQLVLHAMSEKAISSGKTTAEQVGRMTFDTIHNAGFCIYPHPYVLAPVQYRFEDIISRRNLFGPFGGKPDVRARLVDTLRG